MATKAHQTPYSPQDTHPLWLLPSGPTPAVLPLHRHCTGNPLPGLSSPLMRPTWPPGCPGPGLLSPQPLCHPHTGPLPSLRLPTRTWPTSHQQGCCCHGTRAGPFSMGGEGAGVPRGAGRRAPEGEAEAPRHLPDFHCVQAQPGVNSLRVIRAGLQGTMAEPRSRTFQIKRRRIGLGSPGVSEPKAIPSVSRGCRLRPQYLSLAHCFEICKTLLYSRPLWVFLQLWG